MMPRAPIEPEGMFDGLSASAILLGAFVDIATTMIAVSLFVLWLAPDVMSPDQAVSRKALAESQATAIYVTGNVVLGALGTVLGAFVGARRAGRLHVRHGGWIAVTSTAIGFVLTLLSAPAQVDTASPLWAETLAWLLILPAGISGGALAAALPGAQNRER
jgi:predicted MFS family arabinose efflux permease